MRFFKREILRNPQTQEEYMRRYVIFDSQWFGVYIQHFIAPDWSRDPHDHPRRFVSFILRGGYCEEITLRSGYREEIIEMHHLAPSINDIAPRRIHRIRLILPNTWTLCFVGKRVRQWGFHTKDGYVPAREYIGPSYDRERRV